MASYRKTSTGWGVRVSWRDADGELKQKYKAGFKTKNEARLYAISFENDVANNNVDVREVSFADYFDEWFQLYKENKVSQVTANRYRIISRELHHAFEKINIKKVDRRKYQKFINSYGADHAPETVKKLNSIVRACVKSAVYDDLIKKDFTQNVSLTWDKSREITVDYLNISEIKTLINHTQSKLDPHFTSRYMILTAIYTGARLGEIQALTWKDINFNWRTISINKSWDALNNKFKPTKTEGSTRIIRVNDDLLDILQQLQHNDSNMVFVNQYGTIPTSNAVNKTLRQLMADCNVNRQGFHFHSLRHSHVAYLLSQGADLYAISKRLGHTDMTTTSKRYAYLIDEYKAKSDDLIESLLDNLTNKKGTHSADVAK